MKTAYPVTFDVKNAVTGKPTAVAPGDSLSIGSDLNRGMSEQAALFAYYGALAEEEYHRAKRIKFKIHCLSEDLDEEFRREEEREGRTLTERALTQRVKRDPRIRELYAKYIATQRRAGHLRVMKDAFAQRKDMLQSIGANRRRELDVDVDVLKSKVKSRLKGRKEVQPEEGE